MLSLRLNSRVRHARDHAELKSGCQVITCSTKGVEPSRISQVLLQELGDCASVVMLSVSVYDAERELNKDTHTHA